MNTVAHEGPTCASLSPNMWLPLLGLLTSIYCRIPDCLDSASRRSGADRWLAWEWTVAPALLATDQWIAPVTGRLETGTTRYFLVWRQTAVSLRGASCARRSRSGTPGKGPMKTALGWQVGKSTDIFPPAHLQSAPKRVETPPPPCPMLLPPTVAATYFYVFSQHKGGRGLLWPYNSSSVSTVLARIVGLRTLSAIIFIATSVLTFCISKYRLDKFSTWTKIALLYGDEFGSTKMNPFTSSKSTFAKPS